MARLTHRERLERLQSEYNKIIKPVLIVADTVEPDHISVLTVYNTLLKEKNTYTLNEFKTMLEPLKGTQECNIIMDNVICEISKNTKLDMVKRLDQDELKQLIDIMTDPTKQETRNSYLIDLLYKTLNDTIFS